MPKPPAATPHSDLDGVHRDDRPNSDVAHERGESGAELDHAERHSTARPRRNQGPPGGDDRS